MTMFDGILWLHPSGMVPVRANVHDARSAGVDYARDIAVKPDDGMTVILLLRWNVNTVPWSAGVRILVAGALVLI